MLDYLHKAKQYLWAFVELGFLALLSVILIYLILGANSGVFVSGVADNVVKFASACAEPAEAAGVAWIGGLPKRIQARTDRARAQVPLSATSIWLRTRALIKLRRFGIAKLRPEPPPSPQCHCP